MSPETLAYLRGELFPLHLDYTSAGERHERILMFPEDVQALRYFKLPDLVIRSADGFIVYPPQYPILRLPDHPRKDV